MKNTYKVQLIQQGNTQSIPLPKELNLSTTEVTIRQDNEKLIIEPVKKKSLLEVLATLEDIDEDFPDIDQGLLPLDNIEL